MRNSRGQSTQEAAIVISLAIVAVVTMSTFVRRTLQGRIADSVRLESQRPFGGNNVPMQYEPYYLQATLANQPVVFTGTRTDSSSNYLVTPTSASGESTSNTIRKAGSFQLEYPAR